LSLAAVDQFGPGYEGRGLRQHVGYQKEPNLALGLMRERRRVEAFE